VEQPAETVDSLDIVPALEALRGPVGDPNLEVDPAVRALVVVVADELPEHPVEMAFPSDEHPVEALGPGRADKALRERVRPRRSNRGLEYPGAERHHHFIKRPDELRISITN
jgi:hypothetical protein